MDKDSASVVGLMTIGVIAGLGQLLASKEKLTFRVVLGRILSSAALGSASSLLLIAFPSIPWEAQLGAAAALASLGTSALELMFQRIITKK